MYSKRFCVVAVAVACMAVVVLSTGQLAQAEQPETVSITFALTVPFDPYLDATAELSDYVGEDTVVVLIGALFESWGDTMHFDPSSLPCDGVEVAGTEWWTHAPGTIVNKGGPIYARVWTRTSALTTPPPHSALVAHKITEVHACWLKIDDQQTAWAQDAWNWYTSHVFIIVTGEFRVKD